MAKLRRIESSPGPSFWLSFLDGENPQVGIRALGRGLSAVVDSERMVLCEEEVVTIIKNQIPLQLGKQVPSESLLRLLLEL